MKQALFLLFAIVSSQSVYSASNADVTFNTILSDVQPFFIVDDSTALNNYLQNTVIADAIKQRVISMIFKSSILYNKKNIARYFIEKNIPLKDLAECTKSEIFTIFRYPGFSPLKRQQILDDNILQMARLCPHIIPLILNEFRDLRLPDICLLDNEFLTNLIVDRLFENNLQQDDLINQIVEFMFANKYKFACELWAQHKARSDASGLKKQVADYVSQIIKRLQERQNSEGERRPF